MMVKQVAEIEFIVTDTEAEALALEANLIKQHQYFNVLLKDDKKYPYVCVTWSEEYPRIFITRNRRLGKRKDTTDLTQTHGCCEMCGYQSGSSHCGSGLNLVQRPRLS